MGGSNPPPNTPSVRLRHCCDILTDNRRVRRGWKLIVDDDLINGYRQHERHRCTQTSSKQLKNSTYDASLKIHAREVHGSLHIAVQLHIVFKNVALSYTIR